MSISSLVEQILGSVFEHYYHGMPDFGVAAEPQSYAVYTVTHKPTHYISGKKSADSYFIALAVFSSQYDETLYTTVEEAFTQNNFILATSREISSAGTYPMRTQYSMDLTINIDTEE